VIDACRTVLGSPAPWQERHAGPVMAVIPIRFRLVWRGSRAQHQTPRARAGQVARHGKQGIRQPRPDEGAGPAGASCGELSLGPRRPPRTAACLAGEAQRRGRRGISAGRPGRGGSVVSCANPWGRRAGPAIQTAGGGPRARQSGLLLATRRRGDGAGCCSRGEALPAANDVDDRTAEHQIAIFSCLAAGLVCNTGARVRRRAAISRSYCFTALSRRGPVPATPRGRGRRGRASQPRERGGRHPRGIPRVPWAPKIVRGTAPPS